MSAIDKSGIYETNADKIFYAKLFRIAHPTSPSTCYATLRYCILVFIIHNMYYYYYIYLVFLHIVLPKYSARESNLVKKDNDNVVVTFCDSHVTYVTFCDLCHTIMTLVTITSDSHLWQSCHICHILWQDLSLMSHILCHVRAIENMVLQKKLLCEYQSS